MEQAVVELVEQVLQEFQLEEQEMQGDQVYQLQYQGLLLQKQQVEQVI
jgi:hypothetical protein